MTIRAEVLKRVYDNLLLDAKVQFLFQASLVAVESDAGKVSAAVLAGRRGLFAVKAPVFLDGTGDGDLAAWAGASFEKGDEHGNRMAGTGHDPCAGMRREMGQPGRHRVNDLGEVESVVQ